jgi:hypothetical protein
MLLGPKFDSAEDFMAWALGKEWDSLLGFKFQKIGLTNDCNFAKASSLLAILFLWWILAHCLPHTWLFELL